MTIGEHAGSGDLLARGAPSATFLGPKLKIDELEFNTDLAKLAKEQFCDKYMVSSRYYDMLTSKDEDRSGTARQTFLEEAAANYKRQAAAEAARETKLTSRHCFIIPAFGRVIVLRDGEYKNRGNRIILADDPRKRKLLPTTGHVIACADGLGEWMGKRVLFGQMSGTAICFNGMPDWIMLQVEEIMGEVTKEDAQLVGQELEPMV